VVNRFKKYIYFYEKKKVYHIILAVFTFKKLDPNQKYYILENISLNPSLSLRILILLLMKNSFKLKIFKNKH